SSVVDDPLRQTHHAANIEQLVGRLTRRAQVASQVASIDATIDECIDVHLRSECAIGEGITRGFMGKNLLDKVWEAHSVRELPSAQTQLFIGLHLIHEVTSPQAFQMMREQGLRVLFPERTFATVDHIIPTDTRQRPYADSQAEGMMSAIERNCREFGIRLFDAASRHQGIVPVLGPELSIAQ